MGKSWRYMWILTLMALACTLAMATNADAEYNNGADADDVATELTNNWNEPGSDFDCRRGPNQTVGNVVESVIILTAHAGSCDWRQIELTLRIPDASFDDIPGDFRHLSYDISCGAGNKLTNSIAFCAVGSTDCPTAGTPLVNIDGANQQAFAGGEILVSSVESAVPQSAVPIFEGWKMIAVIAGLVLLGVALILRYAI